VPVIQHCTNARAWRGVVLTCAIAGTPAALSQTVIDPTAENEAEEVLITGRRSQTVALPVSVANDSIERRQIEATNVINPEDALRYVSNFQIRKRYIGDQNGAPAARGSNGPQSARSLVLLDGIPISNFIGSGFQYSPKWGLIAPDEMQSIDVMYGPYSALYSGNTFATGVFITTRMPEKFELATGLLSGFQRFHGYDTSLDLSNTQYDLSVGNRNGSVSWALYANRFDVDGNPANFLTVPVSSGSSTLPGTPVSGAIRETDAAGIDRYVFGTSSVFDESADLVKSKVSWDIDPGTRLFATVAYRDQKSRVMNPESYLRDAGGNRVITGRVRIGDRSFDLNTLSILQQSIADIEDLLGGVTFTKRFSPTSLIEASASEYGVLSSDTRTAAITAVPIGQVNRVDSQGWRNGALRWIYGSLVLGGDVGMYWSRNSVYNSPNYAAGATGALTERNNGKTRTTALFAEKTFGLASAVDLTAGVRWEHWDASDGARITSTQSLDYPERSASHWSPKAVLTWKVSEQWTAQARAAEAWRFPTVAELFQSRTTGGYLIQSDPNLRAERAHDVDLSLTRRFRMGEGNGRASVGHFHEDVTSVIYSQYNAFTQATYNQNVDRVRSRGVELNFAAFELAHNRLDLDFNVALQDSVIRANAGQPATVGKDFPRIPNVRGKLQTSYRPTTWLTTSVAFRYEGRQYNDLLNTDNRSGGYGYLSEYFLVDLKAQFAFGRGVVGSIGIDNVFDELAYYYHPYPMRTVIASLRWRPQ
jgi:iron complex outermembrane receptor protein